MTQKKRRSVPRLAYSTKLGRMYKSKTEAFLDSHTAQRYRGKVQLLFTSPPFPLNTKKRYGNLQGEAYIEWLAAFAPAFRQFLKPGGSIVMEIGNAWEPKRPIMSTLGLEALLAFKRAGRFRLIQQFIVQNPARLPSPAQWVNVERIRVKDTFTHVWWLARSDRPSADNKAILVPYSDAMKQLLETKKYNSGDRPSQHHIGAKSFLNDNGGAIPSNVLSFANTASNGRYLEYCRKKNLVPHPARMQPAVADFFIRFLTKEKDLVFDPFAGSNTTGAEAERLGRRWISVEGNREYIRGSRGRF
jgi:site-specific DNA-methyltransferase (cytosine-N4-specific)